jgi:hypothetical protein
MSGLFVARLQMTCPGLDRIPLERVRAVVVAEFPGCGGVAVTVSSGPFVARLQMASPGLEQVTLDRVRAVVAAEFPACFGVGVTPMRGRVPPPVDVLPDDPFEGVVGGVRGSDPEGSYLGVEGCSENLHTLLSRLARVHMVRRDVDVAAGRVVGGGGAGFTDMGATREARLPHPLISRRRNSDVRERRLTMWSGHLRPGDAGVNVGVSMPTPEGLVWWESRSAEYRAGLLF